MTKKDKLAQFDSTRARMEVLGFAVNDLVNHKFGPGVKVKYSDYTVSSDKTFLTMQASWRHMPLILVRETSSAAGPDATWVYTESEIIEMFRANPTAAWSRMLANGLAQLHAKAARPYASTLAEVAE